MNPTEEAWSDGVAFALSKSDLWKPDPSKSRPQPPDAFVRGLRLNGRTFQNVEWDILCVRDDGELLEAMEAKVGTDTRKLNELKKQLEQRVASRLFNRVWALWEGEGRFRGGATTGFGTLRLRPLPGGDDAFVELVEEAPLIDDLDGERRRRLIQKARAFTRPRRRLPTGDVPVFLRCPACKRGGAAYFYAPDYNQRIDYLSGEHAWFCEETPDRNQRHLSVVNDMMVLQDGVWVGGAHATRRLRL